MIHHPSASTYNLAELGRPKTCSSIPARTLWVLTRASFFQCYRTDDDCMSIVDVSRPHQGWHHHNIMPQKKIATRILTGLFDSHTGDALVHCTTYRSTSTLSATPVDDDNPSTSGLTPSTSLFRILFAVFGGRNININCWHHHVLVVRWAEFCFRWDSIAFQSKLP